MADPEDAFETVKPLFTRMGKNITRVGGNGNEQACKVASHEVDQKS